MNREEKCDDNTQYTNFAIENEQMRHQNESERGEEDVGPRAYVAQFQ